MIQIDFYLHEQAGQQAQFDMACRLLQKAWGESIPTYVYTADQATAEAFDDLLWVFNQKAFIPHCLHPQDKDLPATVRIGQVPPPEEITQLLINLSETVPPFYTDFKKLYELIPNEERLLSLGRERYSTYKEQGYRPRHHKISGIRSPRLRLAADQLVVNRESSDSHQHQS